MFTKKFERRIYIAVGVLAFSAALGVSFGAYILWPERRETGYEPEQPIHFSHKLHAGTLQIHCQYCHSGAEKGAHATVPEVSTCMNCHTEVQPKDQEGNVKEEIAKLLEYWENSEPIRWNKVTDLADFVYFDHSRHIASGLACQECHGPVEAMDYMRRHHGMKMSWCLDCHKQDPTEPPPPYAPDRTTRAPINCTVCHR
ncbi:MAG: cytochrome c3 family protein [Phycisphaerae bacterium]|jgi:hypothetical protein